MLPQQKNRLCNCGCGKEVTNDGNRFLRGHFNRGKKQSVEVRKRMSNAHSSKEYKEKYKPYFLGKMLSPNHKNKISESMKLKEVQEKQKRTNSERFSVENPMQSKKIRDKFEQTMIKNYGSKHALQVEKFQKIYKQTTLDHFGVENPMQSKKTQEKSKLSCFKNNGVKYPYQSKKIREKGQLTCKKNYGVDNYSKTFEFRQFAREQMITFVESGLKDGETFSPMKGQNEKPFISDLQKYTSYFIDNDAKIIGYFPDGYIKELNLVIEFDEPYHNGSWSKKHDIQKDEDYQKIGLKIFRVSEKDWLTNKEQVITQFQSLIFQLPEQIKNFDKEFIS